MFEHTHIHSTWTFQYVWGVRTSLHQAHIPSPCRGLNCPVNQTNKYYWLLLNWYLHFRIENKNTTQAGDQCWRSVMLVVEFNGGKRWVPYLPWKHTPIWRGKGKRPPVVFSFHLMCALSASISPPDETRKKIIVTDILSIAWFYYNGISFPK